VLDLEASATTQLAAAAETLAATQAQVVALEAAKSEAEAAKVTAEAAKVTAEAALAAAEAKVADLAVIQAKLTQFEDAETAKLSQRPFRIPLNGVAGLNASHSDAEKSKPSAAGVSSAFKTPNR
jgi:multidrug efflux pump subunit AcrA (membrane-fusion protein)